SSFNNLSELIDRTNPGEIIMGISSFYNRIVIDLNHSDDKENEAFLNATLPFEQFIFINYLFDNNSLPLRSTSDSPSSRPHNKRILERFFVAGEGLATSYDGQLTLSCSAGFSAIDNATNQLYLITSARCFPYGSNVPIFHAPWEQLYPLNELDYFGNVTLLQQTNVDFAFILKVNPNFKITPMMRTSVDAIKQLSIDVFNTGEFPIPEEHLICVSGFFSHVKCGLISTINTRVAIESVRQAVVKDNYYGMLKANIRHVGNAELGATVFSIEFPEDGPYQGMVILVIHGIVTRVRGQTVVIQPLSGMINFALTRSFFSRLRFIDMETFRELDPQQ
ncbi:43155_t:CDS:1, partial [Gigaspora margarita]